MGAAMSDPNHSRPRNEVSETACAEWVDQIADRFETAWRRNRSPRVEDFVADTPEPARSSLLRALLVLELDYSYGRRTGESPSLQELCQRFPDHVEVVEAVFHRAAMWASRAAESDAADHDSVHERPTLPPEVLALPDTYFAVAGTVRSATKPWKTISCSPIR